MLAITSIILAIL